MKLNYFVLREEPAGKPPKHSAKRLGARTLPNFDLKSIVAGQKPGGLSNILADLGRLDSLDVTRGADPAAATRNLSVEQGSFTHGEADAKRLDKNNKAVAIDVALSLITPMDAKPSVTAGVAGLSGAGEDPVAEAKRDQIAWGVRAVGADSASCNGDSVTVAIIDSGIDLDHPAFAKLKATNRIEVMDFTGSGAGDQLGHGTHCAGVICGGDVDGVRIGVAPNIKKLLVAKVFADTPSPTYGSANLMKALRWVQEGGGNIVSMSLGFKLAQMEAALRQINNLPQEISIPLAMRAYGENIIAFANFFAMAQRNDPFFGPPMVFVCAAGNESLRDEDPRYAAPATLPGGADPNVLTVAALKRTPKGFDIAAFSNGGAAVCAPGVDIVSAKVGGGLGAASGTSSACPHVAGVAALWWDWAVKHKLPDPAAECRSHLRSACVSTKLEALDDDDRGSGLVFAPQTP